MTLSPKSLRTACRDSHPLAGAMPAAGHSPFRGIHDTQKLQLSRPGGARSAVFLKRSALLVCVVATTALVGCSSVGGITGAVAGVASGSATGNPAVGIGVGIAVKAGVDFTINTVLRSWQHDEQLRIASLIGTMNVGDKMPWEIKHQVPYNNEQGKVTVVRAFTTPLAECKEALFSVEGSDPKVVAPHFVTTVCAGADGWKWALAEPAVARWGALQ